MGANSFGLEVYEPTLKSTESLASSTDRVPTRVTLGMLALLGMINAVMVRVNLSVAIVAMVSHNRSTVISKVKAHCTTAEQHNKEDFYNDSKGTSFPFMGI